MTSTTTRIARADLATGFHCGVHALDDYFGRHALSNDQTGVSIAYVLRRTEDDPPGLPPVFGYYTLSMAQVESAQVKTTVKAKLPRYPLPVALIGRLAVDQRMQGRRLGEKLLIDALRRVADAAARLGCIGVIVDAKDERAQRFYARYDFVPLTPAESWPLRMFLALETLRIALEDIECELRPGTAAEPANP